MIEAWLDREKGFVKNEGALKAFSLYLAEDLFVNRAARGAERMPRADRQYLLVSMACSIVINLLSFYLDGIHLMSSVRRDIHLLRNIDRNWSRIPPQSAQLPKRSQE